MMYVRVCLLGVLLGCGSVTSSQLTTDAGVDVAGDPGGAGGDGGAGGVGGSSPGGGGGRGGAAQVDAGAEVGNDCLEANAPGFAFGPGCDAGACRASCELDGHRFVGCVSGSAIATRCYAGCSDCP